jgi:hypothetical protein
VASVTLEGGSTAACWPARRRLGVVAQNRAQPGGAETVTVSDTASVAQNVLVGGERWRCGSVGHDVLGGAEELEVQHDRRRSYCLLETNDVAGAGAHQRRRACARRGKGSRRGVARRGDRRATSPNWTSSTWNRIYLTGRFYGWEIVWLAAAFVAGLVLLWVVPALQRVPFDGASTRCAAAATA